MPHYVFPVPPLPPPAPMPPPTLPTLPTRTLPPPAHLCSLTLRQITTTTTMTTRNHTDALADTSSSSSHKDLLLTDLQLAESKFVLNVEMKLTSPGTSFNVTNAPDTWSIGAILHSFKPGITMSIGSVEVVLMLYMMHMSPDNNTFFIDALNVNVHVIFASLTQVLYWPLRHLLLQLPQS